MSPAVGSVDVASFLAGLFAREGALAEVCYDGAIACVLPPEMQSVTGLSESSTLRVLGVPREGETLLPIESAAVRWCVETACSRGRIAAASLPGVRAKAHGLAEAVLGQFGAINGTLRMSGTRPSRFHAWILEFRYEAVGEERSEGSLHIAFEPALRSLSLPLANLLLEQLGSAEPRAPALEPAAASTAASVVDPFVRSVLATRLAPLRASLARRMDRDAHRLIDYHETLLREARKRKRGDTLPEAAEALHSKQAAIVRQRDEKLRDLAFRYSVEVRYSLASVLELSYPVSLCDVVFLRRRREIHLALPWDPFLRGVPPIACPTCGQPSLAFHACDEAGHLTCAVCAIACSACGRVTCRACHREGCEACGRSVAGDSGNGGP